VIAPTSRQWRLGGWAAVAVLVLVMLWTAKHTGAGIDQYADQQYFINNLHGFVSNERFPFVDFGPTSPRTEASYGYTFQALTFFISWGFAVVRGDDFDPFSAGTYTDKNVMVALLSLVAFYAVYRVARALSGDRRVAITAVVLLVLTPVFTGHALMNQKDIPLAVGFTALTAGVVTFCGRLLHRDHRSPAALAARFGTERATAVLLGVGVAFTVGTRPAAVSIVFLDVLVMAAVAWRTGVHRTWPVLRLAVIGLIVGAVVVMATNSAAWPNPIAWLKDAIDVSRGFPSWSGKVLVDDRFFNYDAEPRWYLPFMLAVQTPMVIAALGVTGVWFGVHRFVASRQRFSMLLLGAPVLLQLVALPAAGVLQQSLFYNAARQVLFVLPMMAVVAAIGVVALDRLLRGHRTRLAAGGLVALAALSPAIDTVTLFPYQYVYYNEVVRTDGLTDRYEFDYWGISGRETQQWVNENYPNAIEMYPRGWQFPPFAGEGIRFTSAFTPGGTVEKIFAANYYPAWDADPFQDCPVVHTVTRRLWGQEILLGYVRRCTGIR